MTDQKDLRVDVTPWDEDSDAESLIGAELTEAEARAAFGPEDTDQSTADESRRVWFSEAELKDGADPALRAMSWHLAPSLARLRAEINQKWPGRDKASDGSIGDSNHKPPSDHLPNGRGSVNAIDIDKDGISPLTVVNVSTRHPATNYIIWNRMIFSRSRGFNPARYTGDNPHTHHIHVSILQNPSAEQSGQPWGLASTAGSHPPFPGELTRGSHGEAVKTLQRRLNERGYTPVAVDGDFGPATDDRVRAFQRFAGIVPQDGRVGPYAWQLLWTLPIT